MVRIGYRVTHRRGEKFFNKLQSARRFAKSKAKKSKASSSIYKITVFPRARPGQTDWKQRKVASVTSRGRFMKPTGKRKVRVIYG